MRLAEFVRQNTEAILLDWEAFANSICPGQDMNRAELRDHAEHMLLAIATDIEQPQSKAEQQAKAKGLLPAQDSAAQWHGHTREASGFSIDEIIAE